jgi:serine/threonine protein kinase/tetratricopeptide (TPR) repeat protein
LTLLDERQAKVVELRFFGRMSEEETANALGISSRTVKRDWRIANAWLFKELSCQVSRKWRNSPAQGIHSMDQDRWKRINQIFHAALDVSHAERPGFVARVSGGDPALADEVNQLLKADEEAGSYIELPLVESSEFRSAIRASDFPLRPGDVLCGRFKIVRSVGEGGMGRVFEAFDMELSVGVALKVIRPEIAANPSVLTRFRQEVRLARRITHPNVCRTFDLEREKRLGIDQTDAGQEILFLTMEFLEGETLAAKIARQGALSLEEALEVATQVGSGLEAARALGVVHRDIKPANIMLTAINGRELRVVITDFGLARVSGLQGEGSSGAVSSSNANPVGTLSYMAPEQLQGVAVSTATDIYAFGLVMFEMVTGKRAFPTDELLTGITQRLAGTPLAPSSIVHDLPEGWCRAIQGCLRVKAEERFASAAAVLLVLNGKSVPVKTQSAFRRFPDFMGQIRRPRGGMIVVVGILISLAVASLWGGLRLMSSKVDSKVAPGALIYVPPVRNETGDKSLDRISELIRSSLSQSAQINLLDEGRVGDTLQQMARKADGPIGQSVAREIAMRAGAVRVIFVTVSGKSGIYQMGVEVQQLDNTPNRYRNRWRNSFVWQTTAPPGPNGIIPQELLISARDAADWIRREVGESANDISRLNAPPDDATTTSWEALQDYAQSETLVRQARPTAAVLALEHAVKDDPNFALAWGRMGDLLLAIGRDTDGYVAYRRALDSAQQSRLTRKEEDRIRGMRAVDTADYQLAVDSFHDYTLNYPNDATGWAYPLRPLRMLGRDGEAISDVQRAIALDSQGPFAPYELAQEMMLTGRNEEALQLARGLRPGFPDFADCIERALYMVDRQFDRAANMARRSEVSSDPMRRSYGYEEQASLAADRGDYQGAIAYLDRGLERDTKSNVQVRRLWKLIDRAYIEIRIGDFEDCLKNIHEALHATSSPWAIVAADTVLGNAYASAPAKYRHAIQSELTYAAHIVFSFTDNGSIFEFARLRTDGELQFASGNQRAAVAKFRLAAVKDAPVEHREYLGRAFVGLAQIEPSQAKSRADLQQAFDYYSVTALDPRRIWCEPSDYLPGFFGDQLRSFLEVAKQLGIRNTDVKRAEEELRSLRATSRPI